MPRYRLFIALEIDEEIRHVLTTLQFNLGRQFPDIDVKWVEPENLHVTLIFLGDVDDRDLHGITKIMKTVGKSEPPFPIRVQGMGAFPSSRRPKILWAGLGEGQETVKRLHQSLSDPLMELGCYRAESRDYTPHLTLGRIQADSDNQALSNAFAEHKEWTAGTLIVSQLTLYTSEMRRGGPEYSVMEQVSLTGSSS